MYSLYTHVPGLKVVAPSTACDAKGLLISAIRDPDPVVFIEDKRLYMLDDEVPEEPYTIPLGSARIVRPGRDVTIVGIQTMVVSAGLQRLGRFNGAVHSLDWERDVEAAERARPTDGTQSSGDV